MDKPSLPKGTRDFGPAQMAKRQFILNAIRTVFQKYGFMPLETPAMENLSTLSGKYGEEGDQLLFRILNSGDYLKDVPPSALQEKNSKAVVSKIAEKGLRYDLTIPFARYVVMNRHEITLPFKRYQIQPVWRADRPQKGRYREFYQCDADVVGTDWVLAEVEIIAMIKEILSALKISGYTIKVNHRGILSALAETAGAASETDLFVAIDKLDKIGEEKVRTELASKGFSDKSLNDIFSILNFRGSSHEKLKLIESHLGKTENRSRGMRDMIEVFALLGAYHIDESHVEWDISLARGLSYYTGCIFEVKVHDASVGSVSGGGRYDNLTQLFGSKDKLSGVGISFGIDRIYDAMEELGLFPDDTTLSTAVLICHLDVKCRMHGIGLLKPFRDRGVSSELYPDSKKLDKQLDYANNKKIPFALIIGPDELESEKYSLKDLRSGNQERLSLQEIIERVSKH